MWWSHDIVFRRLTQLRSRFHTVLSVLCGKLLVFRNNTGIPSGTKLASSDDIGDYRIFFPNLRSSDYDLPVIIRSSVPRRERNRSRSAWWRTMGNGNVRISTRFLLVDGKTKEIGKIIFEIGIDVTRDVGISNKRWISEVSGYPPYLFQRLLLLSIVRFPFLSNSIVSWPF